MAQFQSVQAEPLARHLWNGAVENLWHGLRGQDAVPRQVATQLFAEPFAEPFQGRQGTENAAVGGAPDRGRAEHRERVDPEHDQERSESLIARHLLEHARVDLLTACEQRHRELPGRATRGEGERAERLGELGGRRHQAGNNERGHE